MSPQQKDKLHIVSEWIWRAVSTGLMLLILAKIWDVGVVIVQMKSDVALHTQQLVQHDRSIDQLQKTVYHLK